MILKPVRWLGDSRERIREFPDDSRREAGHELERVQAGIEPADPRPMPSPKPDIDLAGKRFRDLVQERKRQ